MNPHIKVSVVIAMLMIVVTAGCVTQPVKPVEVTDVVEISGQDKAAIFNKSRQWFSQYFVSGKSVVDYENKDEGTIIGNGFATIGSDPLGIIKYGINYNMRIDAKDGRMRVITNITKHSNMDHKETYDVGYISEERNELAKNHVQKIVLDIKDYLLDKKFDKANANW